MKWRSTISIEGLREAPVAVGADDAALTLEKVDTPEDAARLDFYGSPTIVINGRDPSVGEGAPAGLSCRISATEDGPQGSPSVLQPAEAMRS